MKKYAHEIRWGIYFILMQLIWLGGEKQFGLHNEHISEHAKYSMFVLFPSIAIYVFALLEKRKQLGGSMTYMQGLVSGILVSIVVMILTPFSVWASNTIISPDYFENVINYTVSQNIKTREQAEAYFNMNNYIFESTMFAPMAGLVTSALVAVFVKRNPK